MVEVPGTIVSPDTATSRVGSVVEGRVESVRVLPGDVVARGQELMRIHSHELTDALRDLRAAEANLAYSDAALGRTRELLEAGAISREEVQRRQAENEAMRAEMARSQELVDHLSPSDDGAVVIRAPRAGTVFQVSVKPGDAVVTGSPLVEVGRTDVLWATGWVPEEEAVRLTAGDSVRVRVQAIPESDIHGRVVRMGGVVDPLRRAVEIRAELAVLPPGIRPGLFATVLVPSGPVLPRAVLPAETVQHTPSGDMVFLEEGPGLFRPTSVEVVVLPDGTLAVTGLDEGDRVVTLGAYAVRSAMEGGALAEEGS
jgi:RND family efflux transporter MFP subunit